MTGDDSSIRVEPQKKRRPVMDMPLLCGLGAVAIFSSTMSKSPILPFFARSLGATPEQMGFIAAASTIPGILVSAPAGMIVDRKGPRLVLLISGLLFALVPFLYLLISSPIQLVAVRFLHGFATAILGPVALAVVAGWYGERRGERMAWYSSSTRVGRMLAPLVGGLLLAFPLFAFLGLDVYRCVYLVCGLLGLTALALVVALPVRRREDTRPTSGERADAGMLRRVMNRRVLLICAVEAATYFLFGAFEFFMPLFWTDITGLPEWATGLLLTLFTATLLVASPLLGALSDQWGRRGFIAGGLAALCLLIILQVSIPLPLLQMGMVVPMAVAMASTVTSTAPLVTELVEAPAEGTALGLLGTIMDVGQALGPICVGLLLVLWGQSYTLAFATVGAVLLILPLLIVLQLPRSPHSNTLSLPPKNKAGSKSLPSTE